MKHLKQKSHFTEKKKNTVFVKMTQRAETAWDCGRFTKLLNFLKIKIKNKDMPAHELYCWVQSISIFDQK